MSPKIKKNIKMKIISWNVNGLRSIHSKGKLIELLDNHNPDILCLQEIRCDPNVARKILQDDIEFKSRYPYIHFNTSKTRKGYSGTAILSKVKPISIINDIDNKFLDDDDEGNKEGRVITAVFPKFILVNVYTPNSGPGTLKRLSYRIDTWDEQFMKYLDFLKHEHTTLALIVCGDLNVAHKDIDIHNPKTNKKSAGFTPEERESFDSILWKTDLQDAFRTLHPKTIKYSWWSALGNARKNNKGWRIDYFLVSPKLLSSESIVNDAIKCDIIDDMMGSDHAPIVLESKNIS